ncbi:4'-phosphopantetheinyl transferase family protein [Polymorphospora rubra]|uniref:4'-phosphopantetheinyl transferase family protein n=1 Tax=Polymorphospora rubra TaxID=338584 RepID=UPI0033D557E3
MTVQDRPAPCRQPAGAPWHGPPVLRFDVTPGVEVAVAHQTRLVDLAPSTVDLAASADLPPDRRAEWLAVRALLRTLLVAELGERAGTVAIGAHPGGQPHLPRRPDLFVSLSHDDGFVAAAVGLGVPVGVDVQVPVPAPPALLRRCCRPDVRAALDRLPQPARDLEFAWLWTVQEACVKATGAGLAGEPWTIPVPYGRHRGRWRELCWVSLRGRVDVPVSVAYRDGGSGAT